MKPSILFILVALILNQATHALSCNKGYSVGYLNPIYSKSNIIETNLNEFRGRGLWYILELQLSSAKDHGRISASNSALLSVSVQATDDSYNKLLKLSNSFKSKKIAALCVKNDMNPLPSALNIQFDQSLEIDPIKPVAQ